MVKPKKRREYLPICNLVRVLFLENQVLDHIKENGIINKKYFKNKGLNNTVSNVKSKAVKKVISNISSNINSDEQSVQNISSQSNNITTSQNINSNNTKVSKNTNKQELYKAFNIVENTLSDYVLGQKEYLSKLTIAFKRPFAYGKRDGVSNTIFMFHQRPLQVFYNQDTYEVYYLLQ